MQVQEKGALEAKAEGDKTLMIDEDRKVKGGGTGLESVSFDGLWSWSQEYWIYLQIGNVYR